VIGKIFITSSGYDPEIGKHVKDPYLDNPPSLGACRPDIRRKLGVGDHVFVISGKVRGAEQFVMGGFEVASKIDAVDAYNLFPERRLRLRDDGQLDGNIVVDEKGVRHALDTHNPSPRAFALRTKDYIIGTGLVSLAGPEEIARGRAQTLEFLCHLLNKHGYSPKEVVGRWGSDLSEEQVLQLRAWLRSLKRSDYAVTLKSQ